MKLDLIVWTLTVLASPIFGQAPLKDAEPTPPPEPAFGGTVDLSNMIPVPEMPPAALKKFEETWAKAEKGDAVAQCLLGDLLSDGKEVPRNATEAVRWYKKAAGQGNARAQLSLGNCYFYGLGVAKDGTEAVRWYRKAADQGEPGACDGLSNCYSKGIGVAKNEAEALKWNAESFKCTSKLAEQGNPQAQFNLSRLYSSGNGVPRNEAEADKWCRIAAENGNAVAQKELGYMYAVGVGMQEDVAEAVKWFRNAAQQDNPCAMCFLGICYLNGKGVDKDAATAVSWFNRAAQKGDQFDACVWLGRCYWFGQGVPRSLTKGVECFQKSFGNEGFFMGVAYYNGWGVEQNYKKAVNYFEISTFNDLDAELYLGKCYERGTGVERNEDEAKYWRERALDDYNRYVALEENGSRSVRYYHNWLNIRSADSSIQVVRELAEEGDAAMQGSLAAAYDSGALGLPKDPARAVKWYNESAGQGDYQSAYALATHYANGSGVPRNMVKAANWYLKAAEQGYSDSQFALGWCYFMGDGVIKDYVEAYKWMDLASAQGQSQAQAALLWMEQQMGVQQIAEAQRRSGEFKPIGALQSGQMKQDSDRLDESKPNASGTGFFITDEGYLVTSAHVVKGATRVRLATGAGLISAQIVKVNDGDDLALLKAEGQNGLRTFAALPIISSRQLRLGSPICTVGFPNVDLQGFSPKLAKGEIASLSGAQDDPRYFQISTPVQPGNSGGALVDGCGNVVGVISAKLDPAAALATSGALPENVSYAIKSSFLLGFLESVPEVAAKLKDPITITGNFEDVVKSAEKAAVLVLVY